MEEVPDLSSMETEGKPINLRNEVRVVVAGKTGGGKSTLISTVFGVKIRREMSANPITTENKTQVVEKNGITMRITDTVGLQEGEGKQKELKKLAQHLKQPKVDILIYCLSINLSSKFADSNPAIMKSLQDAYGLEVWENCILALTFSNIAWEQSGEISEQPERSLTQVEEYTKYINEYINLFKEELKNLKANVDVQLVHDFPLTPTQLDPNFERTILAIPAGLKPKDEILPEFKIKSITINVPDKEAEKISINSWIDIFFYTTVLKCTSNTRESFLKYKLGTIRGKLTAVLEVLGGAGVGAAAGGAVGAAIGSLVGGPGAAITGMRAGAKTGAIIGSTAAALTGETIITAKNL